jgi:hypothetical protein
MLHDRHDDAQEGLAGLDGQLVALPLLETAWRLLRAAGYEAWDHIADWRARRAMRAGGWVPCPTCDAGDGRDECRTCEGYGCIADSSQKETNDAAT